MIKSLLSTVLSIIYKFDTSSLKKLPKYDKTLIVANHLSLLDGLIVMAAMPYKATVVVNTQIAQHPLYKKILKNVPHLTVSPNNPMAMKQIIKLVDSGEPVVIFPEGRISVTSRLMKIYDGTAFIAARTGAAVVPLWIEGVQTTKFSYTKHWYTGKTQPITIKIGNTEYITTEEGISAKVKRQQAGLALTKIMQKNMVAAADHKTIMHAFLNSYNTFGSKKRILEDIRLYDVPSVPAMSYKEVLTAILAIKELSNHMSRKGEYVGIMMPNASPTVAVVLGMMWGGRIPCMLNYTAGIDGIKSACTAANIKTILTSKAFIQKGNFQYLIDGLKDNIRIVYAEDLKQHLDLSLKLSIAKQRLFPLSTIAADINENTPAVVLFTSGSEGKPKGVVHTHKSILANVSQINAVADFNPMDKFLVALPLFHSFGFTAGCIMPMVNGYNAFYYPSPLHYRNIPEIVYDRQCTVLFGTSTFLGNYARFAHPYDFANVKTVVSGAEKLNTQVKQIWNEKFGVRILEGYGVTECAPVIAVNTRMINHPGSVGALVPGMEMKLEKVPGIEEGGRLIVKGPNVMAGYLKYDNPGVLQPTEHDGVPGWYDTGDIVKIENGCIVIQGRAKRFAKIAGEMVSLEVAEKIAISANPNAQHAIVSIPSQNKGEALVLFTTDKNLTTSILITHAKQLGIPELAVAKNIKVIEKIPLLGTGKTDYVTLNNMVNNA